MARQVTDLLTAPTALATDPTGSFGGDLLTADDFIYGRDLPSPGNRDIGSDRLKRIKTDGAISEVANFGGANALAWGLATYGNDLLVADIYWQKVYRINATGTATELLSGRAFSGLALSLGGAFPAGLYAGDYNANCIISSNINGTVSILATNIPAPISLAIDPTGRFGNDLFVASFVPDLAGGTVSTRPSGLIYRVQPNGVTTIFASGLRFRNGASGDLAFGFNGDLFVLEDGRSRILRFSPAASTPPELSIVRLGKSCLVSWPATAVNWVLESTESLSPTIHWTVVTTAPVIDGDYCQVTIDTSDKSRFYRLRHSGS